MAFQIAKRIAEPTFNFRWRILVNVVYRVSIMMTGLFVAQIFGQIIQAVSSHASFDAILALGIESLAAIAINIVMLFIIVLLRAGYPNLHAYTSSEIRKKVLDTYFTKESSIHAPTGKTLAIFENGMASWIILSLRMTTEDPINIISFIIGFGYLVYADIGMLPIALGYMTVVALLSMVLRKKIRPINDERRRAREHRGRVFVRAIMEKSTALMNGAFGYESARLAESSDRVVEAVEKISLISIPGYRIPAYLLDIIRIVTALFFAFKVTQGNATVADIVTASLVFWLLDRYFQGLLDSYQIYTDEYLTLNRLWEFLDSMPNFVHLTHGVRFTPRNGEIRFDWVTYSYPGATYTAISQFSLTFRAGQKTALVGRSGAGKSTLVKLLLWLIDPSSGQIIVDDQDLRDIRLDSYFPYVGYLPQEPSVFDGTVRENLVYGFNGRVSDERLADALRHARCDFIERMTDGLQTEIGERWIRLSGWERQRLAIARIFLRDPEILVLDEPTSALDSFSEAAITEALHELFEHKTVIVVAHRLQTVKEADAIVVLGSEGIIEQGTHETLLASGGEYARMVDLQSGKIEESETQAMQ